MAEAEAKAGREAALDALRDAKHLARFPGAGRCPAGRDKLDGHARAMDSIEPDAARALRLLARVVAARQFQRCGSHRLAEIGLCVSADEG